MFLYSSCLSPLLNHPLQQHLHTVGHGMPTSTDVMHRLSSHPQACGQLVLRAHYLDGSPDETRRAVWVVVFTCVDHSSTPACLSVCLSSCESIIRQQYALCKGVGEDILLRQSQ